MERHEEWMSRARSALEMARTRFPNIVRYEDMCFQAQQAAEKALKGLLIHYNEEPEFTHSIDKLVKALLKFTEVPETVKAAAKLTDYAAKTRYPNEVEDITKAEYEESIVLAAACVEWVESKLTEDHAATRTREPRDTLIN
jgi:HEPN domain-containing protein